jgi:EAL domain-containing protein (putative c-di-GMP-specific phosphodiesterase class I)/GGDEF domain-containing protein
MLEAEKDDPQTHRDELQQGSAPFLPRLGEVLSSVEQRFDNMPVLGVVLVDASPLASIERAHGHEARDGVLANLGEIVRSVSGDVLGDDDLVVAGEIGRLEVAILAFRSADDRSFYRNSLVDLARTLERTIESRGNRVVYPYARNEPILGVGLSAVMRNPVLGADTQLRAVIEEARRDAALSRGVAQQARRRDFMSVLLGGRVSSVYEPIVSVEERTVFGYEALARGPEGTRFHSPMALFSAAEEQGFVFELDCLCRQSGLAGAEELSAGTNLFLNVRPTTIHDPNFRPDAVIRTLERSGLRPQNVVFEISEQESIVNFEAFREIRDEYRSLGFRFALDDTGAGYASLQAVLQLQPEFIKVDRAFVAGLDTDPGKQTMLRAFQDVAESMGSQIIGEGLDRLEELEMLGELGITFGQGWLFGKPTPLRAG